MARNGRSAQPISVYRRTWGANIRFRRRELGMNQKELADALGVGQQTVSRWENALSVPTDDMRPLLAAVLKMPVYELLPYPDVDIGADESGAGNSPAGSNH